MKGRDYPTTSFDLINTGGAAVGGSRQRSRWEFRLQACLDGLPTTAETTWVSCLAGPQAESQLWPEAPEGQPAERLCPLLGKGPLSPTAVFADCAGSRVGLAGDERPGRASLKPSAPLRLGVNPP